MESVRTMKKLLSFAILGLFFSLPARAQKTTMSGGLGPTAGGAGGGGAVGSGSGTVGFHTLPNYPRTQFQAIDVSGTAYDFTPSSWTSFNAGLAQGQAALAARARSLADVAAETRHSERPKAKLIIMQDAFGNAVIQRQ